MDDGRRAAIRARPAIPRHHGESAPVRPAPRAEIPPPEHTQAGVPATKPGIGAGALMPNGMRRSRRRQAGGGGDRHLLPQHADQPAESRISLGTSNKTLWSDDRGFCVSCGVADPRQCCPHRLHWAPPRRIKIPGPPSPGGFWGAAPRGPPSPPPPFAGCPHRAAPAAGGRHRRHTRLHPKPRPKAVAPLPGPGADNDASTAPRRKPSL